MHEQKFTEQNTFICRECGAKVLTNGNYKHRMQTHNEEQTFKCKNCGELSSMTVKLKRHVETPIVDKPISYKKY